jgi:uncharacterized protein involved in exopolysaccharide biosynthesis
MIIRATTTSRSPGAGRGSDRGRRSPVPGLQNDQNTYYEDPEPYFQTQYKILKGRDLTRRVVRKLHLETVPEFNGTKPAPPTPLSMLSDLKTRLMGYVSKGAPAAPEPPKPDETADESAMVGAFVGRVDVVPVRGSRLVDVTFISEEPKFAADAVNALIDGESRDQAAVDAKMLWLDNSCQPAEASRTANGRSRVREKENALSLDDKQNTLSRLNQLNDTARGGQPCAEGARTTRSRRSRTVRTRTRSDVATNANADRKAKLVCSGEGPASSAMRTSTRRSSTSTRCRTPASARHRDRQRGPVGPQRVRKR